MSFLNILDFHMEPSAELVVVLDAALGYISSSTLIKYTVPVGFKCDLASVPRWVRSVATPWHKSARAGVLHDCCYRWGREVWGLDRSDADDMYMEALRSEGVSRWRAWLQWLAVRARAGSAWDSYRSMEAALKGPKPDVIGDPPR